MEKTYAVKIRLEGDRLVSCRDIEAANEEAAFRLACVRHADATQVCVEEKIMEKCERYGKPLDEHGSCRDCWGEYSEFMECGYAPNHDYSYERWEREHPLPEILPEDHSDLFGHDGRKVS